AAVAEHGRLQDELSGAHQRVREAGRGVGRAQREYDRRVALQQSARARGTGPPRGSTGAEKRVMDKTRAQLKDAKLQLRQAEAAHVEARNAFEGHKLPDREPGMRGPHGEQLTNEQIL